MGRRAGAEAAALSGSTAVERAVRSGFTAVAPLAALAPRTALAVAVGGRAIALVHDGRFIHALDGECPHAGGPLGAGLVDGACRLICPWHAAAFDVATGRVVSGPARKPVRTYQVKVTDGEILLALPDAPSHTEAS